MTTNFRADRVGSALRGHNPTVLLRLPSSFAAFGDLQFLPGYCVLLTDRLGVSRLTDLTRLERTAFLGSMDLLGEAVERACRQLDPKFRRVNLEILGNTDDFRHAPVWPRYEWEPAELVGKPVWLYPASTWTAPALESDARYEPLRTAVQDELVAGLAEWAATL